MENLSIAAGKEIYNRSIEIINSLLAENKHFHSGYSDIEKNIVKRVIHASSDISYADTVFFTGNSAFNSISLLKKKLISKEAVKIVCDSKMTQAGISTTVNRDIIANSATYIGLDEKDLYDSLTLSASRYDFPDKLNYCKDHTRLTRSALSIRAAIIENLPDFIVIGNAPTALIETLDICKYLYSRISYKPALVVGMPLGFVGADIAKNNLKNDPFFSAIGNTGNLGGSSAAAAVVNALFGESFL